MRIVQIEEGGRRRVAIVEEPRLRLLPEGTSVVGLAGAAAAAGIRLSETVAGQATAETVDYDPVYAGTGSWRLLPPVDHPEPSRCLVSGTGLTHLGSAKNRQVMHGEAEAELSDSMKMFQAGIRGGRPASGTIGTSPEWFYKGSGATVRGHGQPLDVPPFAEDGGEEGEIAGVYLVDAEGRPRRIGMTVGNEFSDHAFEKTNYLYLASSKLRTCALGPELVIDPAFDAVGGRVGVEREGRSLWSAAIRTGEAEMCHSLANIEHHHFKFESHRRPGDVHVHFYGAHSLSYGAGVRLQDGDIMSVAFDGFGRPLRNPVRVAPRPMPFVGVQPLD